MLHCCLSLGFEELVHRVKSCSDREVLVERGGERDAILCSVEVAQCGPPCAMAPEGPPGSFPNIGS